MNRFLFFLVVLLLSIEVNGQLFAPDPQGLDYFNKGSELIKCGDYKSADSLLTLALCSFKNENVYFNRGISRLLLNDTIGFCHDLDIAANRYFDSQSEQYFNNICCSSIDTIFYDKKLLKSNMDSYRYYEIIKVFKYDSLTIGTFHDIKYSSSLNAVDYGCDNLFLAAYGKESDIIAVYLIIKKGKYYTKTTKPISINNLTAYNDLKGRARILLNTKYGFLKEKNGSDKLKVYFRVFFDSNGEVKSVDFIGFYPELSFDTDIIELENDLLDIADSYPKVKPAKFFKENVPYTAYDFVEF